LWLTRLRQDPEMGKVVQVQGDQRQNIFNFLTQENICEKSQIKIHGF
jgi:translation initiation factor 1